MNIGIIGYGNIGELLVDNILKLNEGYKIFLSNRTISKLDKFKDNENVVICKFNGEVADNCDNIIISVKSPQLIDVVSEISSKLSENSYIIHTCAGVSFDELSNVYDKPLTCIIPSIASTVLESKEINGVSLIYHDDNLSKENKDFSNNLFSKFSYIKEVSSEKELELFTIVTSCMPAFISLNVDLFASVLSNKFNLDKDEVYSLLSQTLSSSSNLLSSNIFTAPQLIDKVATKKGITQKGLDYIEKSFPREYENLIFEILK